MTLRRHQVGAEVDVWEPWGKGVLRCADDPAVGFYEALQLECTTPIWRGLQSENFDYSVGRD